MISEFCQKKSSVRILKFHSNILGSSEIYYDCASKDILLKTPHELSPVVLSFGVEYNIVNLYIQLPQSRLMKVNLNKTVTVAVNYPNAVEGISFPKRRKNVHKSLNNIPFLFSIMNTPGWPDYDNL